MTGLFVAVEGPKSVGKTTLTNQLREQPAVTQEWIFTKEPTEQFDLSNEQTCIGAKLATLVADDRRQHLTEVIQPALRRDQVVVTDRYVLSSYVFHCLDDVSPAVIGELNAGFPPPDLLIVLLCRPETLRERRVQHGHRTRLSEEISIEDEIIGYIEYAHECRPVSKEVVLCYNETMEDCHLAVQRLVASVQSRRRKRA